MAQAGPGLLLPDRAERELASHLWRTVRGPHPRGREAQPQRCRAFAHLPPEPKPGWKAQDAWALRSANPLPGCGWRTAFSGHWRPSTGELASARCPRGRSRFGSTTAFALRRAYSAPLLSRWGLDTSPGKYSISARGDGARARRDTLSGCGIAGGSAPGKIPLDESSRVKACVLCRRGVSALTPPAAAPGARQGDGRAQAWFLDRSSGIWGHADPGFPHRERQGERPARDAFRPDRPRPGPQRRRHHRPSRPRRSQVSQIPLPHADAGDPPHTRPGDRGAAHRPAGTAVNVLADMGAEGRRSSRGGFLCARTGTAKPSTASRACHPSRHTTPARPSSTRARRSRSSSSYSRATPRSRGMGVSSPPSAPGNSSGKSACCRTARQTPASPRTTTRAA